MALPYITNSQVSREINKITEKLVEIEKNQGNGTGTVGPQGPKGDKGDKGDTGPVGKSFRYANIDIQSNSDVNFNDIPYHDDISIGDIIADNKGDVYSITAVTNTNVHVSNAIAAGVLKGPKGDKGDQGAPFTIAKTFNSVDELDNSDELSVGQLAIIDTGNKEDEDYGKVYQRKAIGQGSDKWTFLIDMSVAGVQGPQGKQGVQGIAGPKGDKGDKGEAGKSQRVATVNVDSDTDVEKAVIANSDGIQVGDYLVDSNGETYTIESVANDTVHVSDVITGVNFKGLKGDKGDTGETGAKGETGEVGPKGADGITPHIDSTSGNWFIGDTDTKVHAQGEQGIQGLAGKSIRIATTDVESDTDVSLDIIANSEGIQAGDIVLDSQGQLYTVSSVTSNDIHVGTALKIDGSENDWITLKGPKGDKGDTGATGPQGLKGDKGDTGLIPTITASASIDGSSTEQGVKVTTSTTSSGTAFNFVFNGFKGEQGVQGSDSLTSKITLPTADEVTNNSEWQVIAILTKDGNNQVTIKGYTLKKI